MEYVDELVGAAREVARSVIRTAQRQLLAGRYVAEVQALYVVPTLEILEDIETRAILAAGGDEEALSMIEQRVAQLQVLRDELEEGLEG